MLGLLAAFSMFTLAQGAQELKPETLLLARIKMRAAENLERLPNYTCLETIERSRRSASSRRYELLDVVRLEVAYVDRREMFAWPGSSSFAEKDITEMVSGGAIGNGSFALHARSVLMSNNPTYAYVGERVMDDGHKAIRYDYRVPMLQSGYHMRVRPAEGIVGYEGSFWVDDATLDLVRLVVKITEIPPNLPVASGEETLDYKRTGIGDHDFLLPQSSEQVLVDFDGNENRNRIRFTDCRQFTGESVVSFDEAPVGEEAVKPKALQQIVLPGGLNVEMKLLVPIEIGKSAVGDPLQAEVLRNVKRKGVVWIPKGARISGRLAHLYRQDVARGVIWGVGLLFERVEFEDRFADFHAHLQMQAALGGMVDTTRQWEIVRQQVPDDPRVGILYMRGERGRLAPGVLMIWRTDAPPDEDKP